MTRNGPVGWLSGGPESRQTWIWLVVLGPAALVWVLFVFSLADGLAAGGGPDPLVVVIWLAIGIGLPLLWLFSSLTVERDRALHMRYIPFFVFRSVPRSEISGHTARTYNPLTEYGGWGVRIAPGKKESTASAETRGWSFTWSTRRG